MQIQLVYTPTADPTCPWGSLHMLKGFLEEKTTHRATVRDLNIEWLHYLARPEQLARVERRVDAERKRLEAGDSLSPMDQLRYMRLLNPVEMPSAEEIGRAFAILRSDTEFYEEARYFDALAIMKRWEQGVSRIMYPGVLDKFSRYGFGPFRNPASVADIIVESTDEELAYFKSFLEQCYLPSIRDNPPDVIGISIPFRFQLWHSVAFVRFVRQHLPGTRIIVGGTALQLFKHARLGGRIDDLAPFARLFDAVVVGEGEEPLLKVLDAWAAGDADLVNRKNAVRPVSRVPNVYVYDPETATVAQPPFFKYHDLNELSCPDYDDCQWDMYISPEPVLTYSPTRGCYWDRCVFCEIGLSADRPTSPSRERSQDLVVADLKRLRKIGRHIYWSVDAIRPAWLLDTSRRMAAEGLDILWGAEVRLDRRFSAEDAKTLKDGGCLAISAGIETGSDRLLKLMDKGTTTARYDAILEQLCAQGIAVYPMTFIGFPTETIDEAHGTVDYLLSKQDKLALIAMPATFYLEGNALITRKPDDFQVTQLSRFPNLESGNGWYWRSSNQWGASDQTNLLARLGDVSTQIMGFLDRPFLGGVDTPHSALYIARLGPNSIKEVSKAFKQRIAEGEDLLRPRMLESPFRFEAIVANLWTLIDMLEAEYQALRCPTGEVTMACVDRLPAVPKGARTAQLYDPNAMSPLDQWLDINFSRDQSREEPMYTQFRAAVTGSGPAVVKEMAI